MNIFWFSFSISLQNIRKKGTSWILSNISPKKRVHRYLRNTIFNFKLKLHLEVGLVEQRYFELFFSAWSIFCNVSRHINILQKNLKTASRPRLRTSPSSRQSSLCKFKCILTFTLLISFVFFRLLIMRHVKNLAEDICKNSFIFIEEENKCDKCANRFRIKWR